MPKPLISYITGTYNRLETLIRNVASIRETMPDSIPYEIIIVDGGSTDGTLQWLSHQPNVRVIQQGQLLGAINAFCAGAYSAWGDYVIMGNDDITFHPESILRAFVHLEQNPTCGAVAFMDNRPAFRGDKTPLSVKLMPGFDPQGRPTQLAYAQVGMFRKWLGDLCGWWGMYDPVMSTARTYGGDNYLSARIWEMGYTVDVVKKAQIHDYILEDTLRATNRNFKDDAFYKLYPRGPRVGAIPVVESPQEDRLRVLYLPIFESGDSVHKSNKRGLREALARHYIVWEADYLNEMPEPDWLLDWVSVFQPHVLLTQLHDAVNLPAKIVAECRKRNPGMLCINWNGDARGLTEQSYLDLLALFDLQLIVNAEALSAYEQHGIFAAYWQIGFEEPLGELPNVPSHDVVFLANCYSDQRRAIEQALITTGVDIGFYGFGWQQSSGNTLYDFAAGEALYKNAKIAIGDTFPGTTAFVSNRVFQALAAGAFLLQQKSERLDEFTGLTPGLHYIEWETPEDLPGLIEEWLKPERDDERRFIAETGQEFVRANFSFDAQVKKLFMGILPEALRVKA